MFAAVAHPARRALVEELSARNDQTLFELTIRLLDRHRLGLTRQAVAKHVAVLRRAGLLTVSTRGRTTLHRLHPDGLGTIRAWLDGLPTTAPPRPSQPRPDSQEPS